ncbi:MAG: AAA family ATPase [Thermomicrobiales bacterium]
MAEPIDLDEARRARSEPPVWSHDDFLRAAFPVPRALITGILDEGSLNSWSRPGGVGKSLVALDAARSIAGHQKFLDEFTTEPGPVLLIDQESSPTMLQRRLLAMQQARSIPERAPFHIVTPPDRILLDGEAGCEQIDAYLRMFNPVLLILDSLTRCHRADENDAGAMADLGAILRRMALDHNVAIVLIDHTRKPGVVNDPGSRLRGSTEKRNMLDTALDFQAPKPDEPLVVTMTKRRWAEPVAPFAVRIVGGDQGLQVVHDGAATCTAIDAGNAVLNAVKTLITEKGPDAADVKGVMALAGVGESAARLHLERYVKADILTKRTVPSGGGRPRTVYGMEGLDA